MERKCWDCGNVAEHLDNVVPHVLCTRCGSQDTRPTRKKSAVNPCPPTMTEFDRQLVRNQLEQMLLSVQADGLCLVVTKGDEAIIFGAGDRHLAAALQQIMPSSMTSDSPADSQG